MVTCNFSNLILERQDVFRTNTPVPCTLDEIDQLEKKIGFALPDTYRAFLSFMGHGAGNFLRGTDCFYQHLPKIQGWAKELLQENNFPKALPSNAFVFSMHQGYQFSFFLLADVDSVIKGLTYLSYVRPTLKMDDLPIYSYCEGQQELDFVKTHDSFAEFLAVEIDLYLRYSMTVAG